MQKFLISSLLIILYCTKVNAQENIIRDTVYYNKDIGQVTILIPTKDLDVKYSNFSKNNLNCFSQKIRGIGIDNSKIQIENDCKESYKNQFLKYEIKFFLNKAEYLGEIYFVYKDGDIDFLTSHYGANFNRRDLNLKLNNISFNNIQSKAELSIAKKAQDNQLDEIKENQRKIEEILAKNKQLEKDQKEKEKKMAEEQSVAKKEKEKKDKEKKEREKDRDRASEKEKEKKIAEAESKKKEADEEVMRLSNQLTELNKQMDDLRIQTEKLAESKQEKSKSEKKKIDTENGVNEKKLDSMKLSIKSLNDKKNTEQKKIAEYEKAVNNLEQENKNLAKEKEELLAQLDEQKDKEKKIAEAEKKKKIADQEINKLNNQVGNLTDEIETLKKEKERKNSTKEQKSRDELKKLEKDNLANQNRIDSLNDYLSSLQSKISKEQTKVTSYTEIISDLNSQNENLTKEKETLKEELDRQKAENQQLSDQLNILKSQTEKLLEDYKQKDEFVKAATKKFAITDEEDIKRSEGKVTYNSELRELPIGYDGQYLKEVYDLRSKNYLLNEKPDESLAKYTITQDGIILTLRNIYIDAEGSYFRFSVENTGPYEFQTGVAMLTGEYQNGKAGTYDKIRPMYMNFPIVFPKSGSKNDVKEILYVAPQKLYMRNESDLYFKVKDRKAKWSIELSLPFEEYRKKLDAYQK